MSKRIANGLTLLSAVVCAGSALLVGRSFFRADLVHVPIGRSGAGVLLTVDGAVTLFHTPWFGGFGYSSESAEEARSESSVEIWPGLTGIRWLGLGWGTNFVWGNDVPVRVRVLILPLWLLPLLTAIPPVRWWRARRREGGRGFAVDGADDGTRAHGTRAHGTDAGDAD